MKRIIPATLIILFILAAIFLNSCAETYQLTVSESAGGSVLMSPSGGVYSEGTRITLTAVPASGYSFTGWGNVASYTADSAISRSIEFIMPAGSVGISAGFTQPGEGWLFMIYMAGDNSLSSYVAQDINEIEQGLYYSLQEGNTSVTGEVKVVILADTSGSADTRLYLAAPDSNTSSIASTVIVDDVYTSTYEADMSEASTLEHFISYALVKYPSEHNALVLWNHGGGVRSLEPIAEMPGKEVCEDDGNYLYMNELQTAVGEALGINPATGAGGDKLDIFGFDACIMGEVENAYEMRNLTDYFVASMAEEWGAGWGYDCIFNKFTTAGDIPSAAEMADILVTQYKESTEDVDTGWPNTMTAVKTSALSELKTQIDKLAEYIHVDSVDSQNEFQDQRDASVYYYTYDSDSSIRNAPYHDLYSFCEQIESSSVFSDPVKTQAGSIKNALASAVVSSYGNSESFDRQNGTDPDLLLNYDYTGTNASSANRGLSIFISHGDLSWETSNHYSNQWWYTIDSLRATTDGGTTSFYIGGLDFCTYDSDGTVETWRELFEAWYDDDYPSENDGDGYTIGTY